MEEFWGFFSVAFLFITFLLFNIFLIVRIDHTVQWNWFIVFIPLWIFFLIYASFISWLLSLSSRNGLFGAIIWMIFCGTCLCLFSVLLTLRIENVITWNWAGVFCPLWLTLLLISYVDFHFPEYRHKFRKSYNQNTFARFGDTIPRNFVLALIIFTILLVLKLELVISWSWYALFSPFWILFGIYVLLLLTFLQDIEGSTGYDTDCFLHFYHGIIAPLVFISFILLVLFLEGVVSRIVYAFIPLFFIEFFGVFILPCLIVCIWF